MKISELDSQLWDQAVKDPEYDTSLGPRKTEKLCLPFYPDEGAALPMPGPAPLLAAWVSLHG